MKSYQELQYFYNKITDNDLHKASFRGKGNKVQELLDKSSICVYKGTKNHEIPLSLAISRGHDEIVDMLLNIYEKDLKSVPNYLKDHNVILKDTFELCHSYIIALGTEQITQVRIELADFTCDVTQMDKEELSTKDFTVILLKATNTAGPEPLFLLPRNQNNKIKLFSIACDLIQKNGVCGINVRCDKQSKTLLHLAAMVGSTDLVMRLMNLGADPCRKTYFNQTSTEIAFDYWQIQTFIEMCKKLELNILNFKEIKLMFRSYAAKAESVLLLIEHLVDERIIQFEEARDIALTNVFSSDEIINSYNFEDVGEKCFEKYGKYINQAIHLRNIISGMINFPKRNSTICLQVINKYLTVLDPGEEIETTIWNGMFHTLIRCGFTNELMEIYDKHPKCKDLLFKTSDLGTYSIQSAIEGNHIELVNFLMDHHQTEMKDNSRMWSRFLLAACNLKSNGHGKDLFMRILNQPSTDPNMIFPYDGFENCLVGTIKSHNFKNFDLILTSGKVSNINSIRTSYGESLLSLAIYTQPDNHISSRSKYNRDSGETRLLGDDETDEDEKEIDHHVIDSDGGCGRNHSKRSFDYQAESGKAEEMNKLFENLIEIGANVFVENNTRGGLLHDAVAADNCVIAEKLLALGLDINKRGIDGNRAIHFVHSCKMLNLLISNSSPEILTSRNSHGEMLIHRLALVADRFIDVFNELVIRYDVNINEVDGSGNSMLHLTSNTEFCEYLLNHGADPHIKNFQGETPLFLGLKYVRPAIVNILLQQPNINLLDITTNGASYLQVLARIDQSCFDLIEKAFDHYRNEFLKLCEIHCNDRVDDDFHILHNNYIMSEYVGVTILTQPNLSIDVSKLSLFVFRRPKIVRLLIERGVDVNEVDTYNGSPLIAAVLYNDEELVDILIEAGADINYQFSGSSLNGTALHVACEYGRIPLIKRLIVGGAKVDIVNDHGQRPFDFLPVEYKRIFDRIWKN